MRRPTAIDDQRAGRRVRWRFLPAAVACTAAWCSLSMVDAAEPPHLPTAVTQDGRFKQRPAWSPDGKRLAFAVHEGNSIRLYVLDCETHDQRRLTTREEPEYDAVWSPDGARLACTYVKQSGTQGDLDLFTLQIDGTEEVVLEASGDSLSHEEGAAWSPDGQRIAYTSTREGNQEVYVRDLTGSSQRRLTNDPAIDAHPAWSPDGKWIAFATERWGDFELALVAPEGGPVTRLTNSPGLDDYPSWSPDGARIAFTSNRDGNLEIYLTTADGGGARNFTRHEGVDNFPAWAADGRLAWVSDRDGGFEIYVQAPPE